MFFNSLDFAIFLPIVFVLYWFVAKNNFKSQNAVIVFSSYVFYGWWDWRFLTLYSSLRTYKFVREFKRVFEVDTVLNKNKI